MRKFQQLVRPLCHGRSLILPGAFDGFLGHTIWDLAKEHGGAYCIMKGHTQRGSPLFFTPKRAENLHQYQFS